jgi:nicotinate phosphoribosyltransferase
MKTGIEHNWQRYALFTDLYQLTMLQAYYATGMLQPAAFELFFRQMPAHRNYILAAGLDDVLEYLEAVRQQGDLARPQAGVSQISQRCNGAGCYSSPR